MEIVALNYMCFVFTENHLGKTISLTSMSSPDAAHRLPYTNNTDRRERKNTENTNIRNVADKFSDRKKVAHFTKLWRPCLRCGSQNISFHVKNFLEGFYVL